MVRKRRQPSDPAAVRPASGNAGTVRVGIGGWSFAPWRGLFYPDDLPQSRELAYASRALSTIEINATFYSTFAPKSWQRWKAEVPDDFVFSVKASRFCTNRKVLAEAGPAIDKFLSQGLTDLGPKLGPINWQFAATKRFDPDDVAAFLELLPDTRDGVPLRHALEVRHESFVSPEFTELARRKGAAIVYSAGGDFPEIDAPTAAFTYARLFTTEPAKVSGITQKARAATAARARAWAERGDVFVYFIAGAKERNPAAATALIRELAKSETS